jgi:SAM-dependent methyltransferase
LETGSFDDLVQQALEQELHGWDFSWLNRRTEEEPLPWDYRAIVRERLRGISSLLDVGTGGGEFLAALAPLPPRTCATEGYPPNVPVARARLEPLGVLVADVSAGEDRLPFKDEAFDLVIDRHNGILAAELVRLLRPGGRYVTQRVGGENCMDLNRFLQPQPVYEYADCSLQNMVGELERAGMQVVRAEEAFPAWHFHDVAGVVFYLKAIPWQIADFSVERYRDGLYRIHEIIQREGRYTVREHRFLVEAVKLLYALQN